MTSPSRETGVAVEPTALQQRANEEVLDRFFASDPVLVDVAPAIEVVPGLDRATILTSGAPLPWEQYTGGQRAGIVGGVVF